MLQDFYEELKIMERKIVPDGMGGFEETWAEGATFQGAITTTNTVETRMAEKQGVTSLYSITVPLNVPIRYADVIKRLSSGQLYRVTSNAEDMTTPKMANVQFKQFGAELFTLTK